MPKKTYFFFWKQGFPKGGEGGPTFGKNSQKIPFFGGVASLCEMFMWNFGDQLNLGADKKLMAQIWPAQF